MKIACWARTGEVKKMAVNPMQSAHAAPRCTAKSKRSGVTCRAPAVTGKHVCRMPGARAGAPRAGSRLVHSWARDPEAKRRPQRGPGPHFQQLDS